MGIFDGCLLASDIDGTLIENGYINPKNIKKIEYFVSEGGHFSLSTGRTAGAVGDILSKIPNIAPSVVANGCMIYDFENEKVLYEKIVPKEDLGIVKYIAKNHSDIGIEAHSGKNVYTINSTRETLLHQEYESLPTIFAKFEDIENIKINKVLLTFANSDVREKLKREIRQLDIYKDLTSIFMDTCAMIDGEIQNYYELVPSGVSKASALRGLCEMLNIRDGCYFCIGDYYNDLEMIKTADISATPVTSPDDIKSEAKYITVSCKDGAVADFIDYLISAK